MKGGVLQDWAVETDAKKVTGTEKGLNSKTVNINLIP